MNYHEYESNKFTDKQVSLLRSVENNPSLVENALLEVEFATLSDILANHTSWNESGDISNIYGFHCASNFHDEGLLQKHSIVIFTLLDQ
jgi:hypothetical protein